MAHDNDYQMDQITKIDFEGMPYWIMPRYIHHYIHNNYEKFSLKLIKNLIKPGDTLLDIGAHYGAYSIYAATKCKSNVIAFEPVNENYEIFKKNIHENNVDDLIETHNAAASNENTEADFNIPWASDSAGFYDHPLAETYKKQKVTVRNVDDVIAGRTIDFMKIDTEGHELTVLEGLKKTLTKNPQIKLLIEANPTCLESAGHSVEELLNYLSVTLNKELYVVDEDAFVLKRITDDIENWELYINGYANILCMPKEKSQFALFVCHGNELGGGELAMLEAVESLRARNIESHVIVPHDGRLRKLLVENGISNSIISYEYWTASNDARMAITKNQINIEATAKIAKIAKNINPTFMVNNSMVCPWALPAARALELPLMWLIHEFGDLDHNFQFDYDITTLRKFISDEADIVVCCSDAVSQKFDSKNVHTIYPMLASQSIVERSEQEAEPIFTSKATLKLCMTGRIQETKGQLYAVQALAELKKKGIKTELVLIGDADEKYLNKLQTEIKKLDVVKQVIFTGFKTNPYALLKQCDIALVCSVNEAFGRVTAEAMLLGKPVVGSRSGGTSELIEHKKTGLLFKPQDVQALTDNILLLTDKKVRERIASTAQREIRSVLQKKANPDAFAHLCRAFEKKDRRQRAILFTEIMSAVSQSETDKENLRTELSNHIQVREELEQEQHDLLRINDELLKSKSWQLTKPIRAIAHHGRRVKNYPKNLKDKKIIDEAIIRYQDSLETLRDFKRSPDISIAVIVHLFYGETWPAIKTKLKKLEKVTKFDLFITVPDIQTAPSDLASSFQSVKILQVPNIGRDVLPFMMIAPVLKDLGYESFLKLHSKRSTHRADGIDWFNRILDDLFADHDTIKATIAKLGSSRTGVIGPAGQYVSLLVNYQQNRTHLINILADTTTTEIKRKLDRKPQDYGFVAGTMFWARFDNYETLFAKNYDVRNFELEKGQIDATFAHALERIFSVLPELQGKSLYMLDKAQLVKIDYATDNIPEWSDVYVKPD